MNTHLEHNGAKLPLFLRTNVPNSSSPAEAKPLNCYPTGLKNASFGIALVPHATKSGSPRAAMASADRQKGFVCLFF